ncbi:carbohydrate ABC transporter permease [Neobacillus niacini]|uniref:carbohydrate ABC transporter permease n=1 Tax=Neobacillus niacini TaxID=86668 RepID=UPI00052F4DC5|nr:carbohydrate ABC transporter permease [Neobacillus niacini]KGM45358.1 sugar ABC transporter permease [Neobacillus niacini]MEC1526115.1 carbohydrate ABC transporter permease [Neobacillus niacini]
MSKVAVETRKTTLSAPASYKSSKTLGNRIGYGILYAVLGIIAVVQVYPLIWLAMFSLKTNQEVFGMSPFALPQDPQWGNYAKAWTTGHIDVYFFNSVLYTVSAVVLTVILASFVTFAITRMEWKLSGLVLGLFMAGYMIPLHSTLIPLFNFFKTANMIDNPMSVILSYVAFNLPITIMILSGFYKTIPREIEEAAVVDGCSVHRIFFQITLPMTVPVLSTTVIINMIYNWNEFVFVNTFLSSDKWKTITVGVNNFVGQYLTDWGAIGATLMISIIPVLIAYFILSDRIVEGIAAGSVKG